MSSGNKKWNNQIQENNILEKKMVENQVPQSVKLSCWWTVAPLFDDLHSTHASPQKVSLGLAHV